MSLLDIGLSIIDKVLPDPKAKDEAKLKLLELQQQGELAVLNSETQLVLGQLEVNKVEAASTNPFVSGWRPAVGWVCVLGLGYQLFLRPLLTGFLGLFGGVPVTPETFPELPIETLMTLLLGMLGIGGMRSFDKLKGTSK